MVNLVIPHISFCFILDKWSFTISKLSIIVNVLIVVILCRNKTGIRIFSIMLKIRKKTCCEKNYPLLHMTILNE